jgi:hypothetical protein
MIQRIFFVPSAALERSDARTPLVMTAEAKASASDTERRIPTREFELWN